MFLKLSIFDITFSSVIFGFEYYETKKIVCKTLDFPDELIPVKMVSGLKFKNSSSMFLKLLIFILFIIINS